MRKYIYILLLLLAAAGGARAQGGLYQNIAFRYQPSGLQVSPGATVTVCATSATIPVGGVCTPPENDANCCFLNSALSTPVPSNPFLADSEGNYSFWAAPGLYQVCISGNGLTPFCATVPISCVPGAGCTGLGAQLNTANTFTALQSVNAGCGNPDVLIGTTGMQLSQPCGGFSMDARPNNNATRGEFRLSCNQVGGNDVSCGELTILDADFTSASYIAGNKGYMTFFYDFADGRFHTQINAFGTDTLHPWCIDPLGGTFTFCFYNNTISSIGIGGGIAKGGVPGIGVGFTHQRTNSCTTAGTAGSTCTTTVSWVTSFVDTNYTVACSIDSATNFPYVLYTAKATNNVVVTITTLTNAAASGIVNCNAEHD